MRIKSPWGSISRYETQSGPRFRLRGIIEGKLKSIATDPSLDVILALAEEMAAEQAGRPTGLTVGGWVEGWLEARERAGRHRDVRETGRLLQKHVIGSELDGMLLKRLEPKHVSGWLRKMAAERAQRGKRLGKPISEGSLRNRLRALSAALSDAVDAGEIPSNPALGVRVPGVAQEGERWTYLELDEIAKIERAPIVERRGSQRAPHGALPLKQRTAFVLAIYTGLREGEIWGLRWEDVRLDGEHPQIIVRRSYNGPTKGGRSRRVPLLPPAVAALKAWRSRYGGPVIAGPVFHVGDDLPATTRDGLRRKGAGETHKKGYDAGWATVWRERLGIRANVRFHDFRHTCASHLIMGSWGRPWRLEEVQLVLGHASRTTTERYAHLAPESLTGAAQAARQSWKST